MRYEWEVNRGEPQSSFSSSSSWLFPFPSCCCYLWEYPVSQELATIWWLLCCLSACISVNVGGDPHFKDGGACNLQISAGAASEFSAPPVQDPGWSGNPVAGELYQSLLLTLLFALPAAASGWCPKCFPRKQIFHPGQARLCDVINWVQSPINSI